MPARLHRAGATQAAGSGQSGPRSLGSRALSPSINSVDIADHDFISGGKKTLVNLIDPPSLLVLILTSL